MKKREFDPLVLVVSGNEEIKAAYDAGVETGIALERESVEILYENYRQFIDKTVKKIPSKLANVKGMKLSQSSQRSIHAQVRQWNVNGYLTAWKMFRLVFKDYRKL